MIKEEKKVRSPITIAVGKCNKFLEENEFPYRLDVNHFLKLIQTKGYNEEEVFGALDQCKRHLGIDRERGLQ